MILFDFSWVSSLFLVTAQSFSMISATQLLLRPLYFMQALISLQLVEKGPGLPFLLQYLIACLPWLHPIAVHLLNSDFLAAAR